MKIPSDFITATGEIHDWEAPMKTLGQIAQEAFDAAPHDHTKTFDKQDWWEAAAQAVRAAVIDECLSACVNATHCVADNSYHLAAANCLDAVNGLKQKEYAE